ncbi:related to SGT1 protein [Rhynchosporium secalis]|uniref:Related to SGT1 protein n=1 Tax=Rhynchosporium secalis TaxID=38038 RepID=A0A1E1MMS2_RHYSE|nr:related to SGT1 protein [Rhynchosporium secalis]
MSTEAGKGQDAIKVSDYPAAIKHLTAALRTCPPARPSPLWLIQRSIAYQRTSQHELALIDADNALLASIDRGKRDLIATSQFRRAVALHGLGRFGDARLCLNWCNKKNDKEKGLTIWMAKVKADYENAGGDEAECNKTTVKEVPDKPEEVIGEPASKEEKGTPVATKKVPVVTGAPVAQAPTPKEKVRTEWYQSTATVTIEIFAKGVPKENATVKITEESVDVSFPVAISNSNYDYTLEPLFSKVDASKSTFRITPHKIEIILHKSLPGLKWSSLEGTEPIHLTTSEEEPATKIPDAVLQVDKAPSYPTSSKNGPTNWDTVLSDENDEEDGEEVDHFFKKLYKDADPDTKRAMMKSYQESNGTSLSTVWSDVGSKTFETMPPDGMEAKKWGA